MCIYIDDILVSGRTAEEHLHSLEAVLMRLEEAGVRLKRDKCFFHAAICGIFGVQDLRSWFATHC